MNSHTKRSNWNTC